MTQTLTRVRHYSSGELGWHNSTGVIYPDADSSLSMYAYWMWNSKADQEDYGIPEQGWQTFDGWWLPVEEKA